MEFKLRILGTASAKPVSGRSQSAHVLSVRGHSFLIDCGEGTQVQMMTYGISPLKIDAIFISHIHGDHLFGLFPLLSTMGMLGRGQCLHIFGPSAIGDLLRFFLSYYGDGIGFEIHFNPVKCSGPVVIYENKQLTVSAFPLNHKIETYGYLFREKPFAPNIDKAAMERYHFSLEEIASLKRGEDIRRTDATSGTEQIVRASDVTFQRLTPRSYAYCSDTASFGDLALWVKGVDLLYHETTYLADNVQKAALRHHSTTLEAAGVALEGGVSKLLIGHYSAICNDTAPYQAECRTVFENTYACSEGDIFELSAEGR